MRPHLVRAIKDSKSGELRDVPAQEAVSVNLRPEHLALVREAMIDVTRAGGTAAAAGEGAAYSIAAKTGTAQVINIKQTEKYDEKRVAERNRDHALFIGYAPAEHPVLALAILVENGGHGGSAAAPLGRAVFDYYLGGMKALPAVPAEAPDDDEND